MKRGGMFFAAFLLISGVLRITGPGSASPAQQEKEASQKTKNEKTEKSAPKVPYLEEFAGKIKDFYGLKETETGSGADLPSYFKPLHNSTEPAGHGTAQFVIALLPDPVHTRLGLFFDRSAEALQQAAQMKHYVFDRAIMPWDRTQRTEASDLKTRQEDRAEQEQRESYPGLMIFRSSEEPATASSPQSAAPSKGPLFVLVVGETPTAGLNKMQFRNALQII